MLKLKYERGVIMNNHKSIVVTGATGQQGGAVARELLANGYKVKAMTRKPEGENAQTLLKLGAEIVGGDLNDAASIEQAVKGAWGVFAVQNSWEAGVEQEELQGKLFAEVAKMQDVQHFVYTSVGSADQETGIPHFDNKWRIENARKLMMGIKPETVLQMVALDDIGRYGLLAFEKHEELNGRAIDIAGDALTMVEAAKVIGDAAGKEVEFVQVPIGDVRKMSEDYAIMLEWFDNVGYNIDIGNLAKEYGIESVTLSDWVSKVDWS